MKVKYESPQILKIGKIQLITQNNGGSGTVIYETDITGDNKKDKFVDTDGDGITDQIITGEGGKYDLDIISGPNPPNNLIEYDSNGDGEDDLRTIDPDGDNVPNGLQPDPDVWDSRD